MTAAQDYLKLIDSDTTIEDKLDIIEKLTNQRLAVLLGVDGVDNIPDKFSYITSAVVAARYVRIGNEGVKNYEQDGLSLSFPDNDFGSYMTEINGYKNGDDFYKPRAGRFTFV